MFRHPLFVIRPHQLLSRPLSTLPKRVSVCQFSSPVSKVLFPTCHLTSLRRYFRSRPPPDELPDDLRVFEELLPEDGDDSDSLHMNPAKHWVTLNKKDDQNPPEESSNQRSLNICLLGVPNAGKSSLINAIAGFAACPYSSKHHTTRLASKSAIVTSDDCQLVFTDTPGVVDDKSVAKFKLERSLVVAPELECRTTDLIVVVQDVSNRYVREGIDKRILRLLTIFHKTPAILVLNKMDTIPNSRRNFDLIRKLTCNHLMGQETSLEITPSTNPNLTGKKYVDMISKRMEEERQEKWTKTQEKKLKKEQNIQILKSLHAENQLDITSDEEISMVLEGVVGWPNFKDVFAVSATKGTGIESLRRYLYSNTISRPWLFSPKLKSATDPREIFLKTVKAKCMEVLPYDIPYKINPQIWYWNVENGILRLGAEIPSYNNRITRQLLKNRGKNLRAIAEQCEIDLQNFFHCEVFVNLDVTVRHKVKSKAEKIESETKPNFQPTDEISY